MRTSRSPCLVRWRAASAGWAGRGERPCVSLRKSREKRPGILWPTFRAEFSTEFSTGVKNSVGGEDAQEIHRLSTGYPQKLWITLSEARRAFRRRKGRLAWPNRYPQMIPETVESLTAPSGQTSTGYPQSYAQPVNKSVRNWKPYTSDQAAWKGWKSLRNHISRGFPAWQGASGVDSGGYVKAWESAGERGVGVEEKKGGFREARERQRGAKEGSRKGERSGKGRREGRRRRERERSYG